jgi:hypothetical protein
MTTTRRLEAAPRTDSSPTPRFYRIERDVALKNPGARNGIAAGLNSPDAANAVGVQRDVRRQQREVLAERLGDEQAIERVAVMMRERGDSREVLHRHWQELNSILGDFIVEEILDRQPIFNLPIPTLIDISHIDPGLSTNSFAGSSQAF